MPYTSYGGLDVAAQPVPRSGDPGVPNHDFFTAGGIAWRLGQAGQITDLGSAVAGIAFGAAADVNISRPSAAFLKCSGDFGAAAGLYGAHGTAQQTSIGSVGGQSGVGFAAGSSLVETAAGVVKASGTMWGDLRTSAASVTTNRTGGAAAALPAAPVRYIAMLDENNNRVYVPAYS